MIGTTNDVGSCVSQGAALMTKLTHIPMIGMLKRCQSVFSKCETVRKFMEVVVRFPSRPCPPGQASRKARAS